MNDTRNDTALPTRTSTPSSDRYQLGEILGRGGMATVYRAFDTHTEREVAIKVLYDHLREYPIIVEHFRREVTIARQLEHPNIVRIYSLHETPEMLGLVMEVHGFSDLKEHLQRHGPLPREQVVEIGTQVLSTLQMAHDLGIIHQDIKPHNILWDPQTRVAKLIDFGLAETDEIIALTRPDSAMGTVEYSAPEQFEDFSTDARADLYSLAITLFELLSGSLPYRSETAAGVIQLHREAPVADVRVFTRGVPSHIAETLRRAMAKLPEDRFASAREMSLALNGETSHELIKPAHSELWEQLKNNQQANPEPTDWNLYLPAARFSLLAPSNPLISQNYHNEITAILQKYHTKIAPEFLAELEELEQQKEQENQEKQKKLTGKKNKRKFMLLPGLSEQEEQVPHEKLLIQFLKKTNGSNKRKHKISAGRSGTFYRSEEIPLASNLTFSEAENIRYELGKKGIFTRAFQRTLAARGSEEHTRLLHQWNFLSQRLQKIQLIQKVPAIISLISIIIAVYGTLVVSKILPDVPRALLLQNFFFFASLASITGFFAALPHLLNFNHSWTLGKLAFQENYLLQFNQTDPDLQHHLINEKHAELYHQLRSNRVRATYERILLTLLHLDEKTDAEQTRTILARATDLATHISQLETRLTTQNQATIFDQLARIDAQLARTTDTDQSAELIDQKTALYQQLNRVDADRTELKNLNHKLLQLAASLDALRPTTLQTTGRV